MILRIYFELKMCLLNDFVDLFLVGAKNIVNQKICFKRSLQIRVVNKKLPYEIMANKKYWILSVSLLLLCSHDQGQVKFNIWQSFSRNPLISLLILLCFCFYKKKTYLAKFLQKMIFRSSNYSDTCQRNPSICMHQMNPLMEIYS